MISMFNTKREKTIQNSPPRTKITRSLSNHSALPLFISSKSKIQGGLMANLLDRSLTIALFSGTEANALPLRFGTEP
jgi:hypothetical protein